MQNLIQVFPESLKWWHLPEILLPYKSFQTWSAAVWWKAAYWIWGSVCWSRNGPCCWSQPSTCVCKSHKYKTWENLKKTKKNIWSELSDLKHEEDKSKYLSCNSSWLLPSTATLIGEYLQCTPNQIAVYSILWVSKPQTAAECWRGRLRLPGCSNLLLTQHSSWKTRHLIYPSKMSQ